MADNDTEAGGATGVLDNPSSTPGDNDAAVTTSANPSTEQVIQNEDGSTRPAEGQRIREQARKDAEERDVVTLADVLAPQGDVVHYDETGALVNADGKRIALASDALDPDVGWTVQHAGSHQDDPKAYPGGPATVPDQTFHPDELPDPMSALQAGLLPQNTEVLNIDEDKFKGKKSLEA